MYKFSFWKIIDGLMIQNQDVSVQPSTFKFEIAFFTIASSNLLTPLDDPFFLSKDWRRSRYWSDKV